MSIESKLQFFAETRHSYGNTALMLSGGATFGKFHLGLLKALHE
jgi:predicted acylesterase/phospholipase RssA